MAEVGTYYITIMPEMSKFTGGVKSALGDAGTESGKSYNSSFLDSVKSSALGVALGNLATKAAGTIASGFNTGINRLDTIKNYPRVMESLGYSTEEADKSIKTIQEHLDGLPTATQEMVTLTQSISDSTGDLDLATKAALGFNDMMLANGASADEMATAQGVLNRVLGKGSATTAQWQSLMSVMPAQLGMVAESMLGAGSSSEDLHAALEDGTLSWNDFLQAIADLDENGYIDEAGNKIASFEEQARANSNGIGTAIDNIRNRIGAGWAEILDRVGQEEIAGTIDKMSSGVKGGMYKVADAVSYVKDAIGRTKIAENLGRIFEGIGNAFASIDTSALKELADAVIGFVDGALQWIADHGELVGGLLTGIAGGIAAVVAVSETIKLGATLGLLEGTPGIIQAVWAAISANPFFVLVGAVAAAVTGLAYFFTQTETGKAIWQDLCGSLSERWEWLRDKLHEGAERMGAAFETIKESSKPLLDALGTIATFLIEVLKPAFEVVLDAAATYIGGVVDVVTGTFELIAGIIEGFRTGDWTKFCDGIKTVWGGLWNMASAPVQAAFRALDPVWSGLKSDFGNLCSTVKQNMDTSAEQWKTFTGNVATWNEGMRQAVSDKWDAIKNAVSDSVREAHEMAGSQWATWQQDTATWNENIRQAVADKWESVKQAVSDSVRDAYEMARGQWSTWAHETAIWNDDIRQAVLGKWDAIKEGIAEKFRWAYEEVRSIIESIKGLFDFSWSLPAPTLPHITWEWTDIGGIVSIPSFGIEWYGKGGVFDTASVIGIGERGREAALPLNRQTYGEIAKGISDEMATVGITISGNTFVVREEPDIERIAEAISRKIRRERMAGTCGRG